MKVLILLGVMAVMIWLYKAHFAELKKRDSQSAESENKPIDESEKKQPKDL